jgi:L-cysteine S-thiosulfotransferase
MSTTIALAIGCAAAAALLAGCSSLPSQAELDAQAGKAIKTSFRDQSFVKTSWLDQDLGQKACSSDKPPDEATADRIMAEALYGVKWPSGGVYIGDWRAGERLAQSGRGMTWTDPSPDPKNNGGNCYNCHQIDRKEISHGTIGPSLWNYGKNRGVTDVTAPATAPIVQYTWVKLWNSKAYAACSNMPRFGHKGLLDEQQLRDIMALLLDPKSPVNQ